ncbi:hypothetical protein CALCODRAFT_502435 [Calocera cornea HHB12733]|uniref:Type II toxin-antitoxin system HicA family toxin n=1 Tax=Calocera cornea HHB12733 TaxID=1353952 RepID=A0A165D917_9BASI|nr:hypothetical protein CALCODRAFT_502435 [Calocera cornea HHB12733]
MAPPKKKVINVPRKQAKLFRKIFADAPPANIKWSELETAMRGSGFDVVRIAGTAVRFQPQDNRDRPVVLYRPHPGKELSPQKVKEIARVLGKRYGWTANMFVGA